MSAEMRHVVLGAGPLGVSVARQLRDKGVDATVWSIMGNPAYDMPGTSPNAVDGSSAAALVEVCRGADVIYLLLNAHYVDWHDRYPPRLSAALEAAEQAGAPIIYHDNVYGFGESDQPLTEDAEQEPTTRKGRLRAEMAAAFMGAVESGRVQGVVGRSADMYGPGALNSSFNSTLGERHFYPMLAGKPVSVLGDIDQPHTYGYVEDVAAGLVTLGSREEALGEVWHLPAAPTLSHREILEIAFDVAGQKTRIRSSALSPFFVKAIGRFQEDVGEVAEMLYQFQRPLVVSHDKFAGAFEVTTTPHRQALSDTLEWYRTTAVDAAAAS